MARRRTRSGSGDKARGVLLGLLGLVMIFGLGAGAYWVSKSKVALDPETNCPLSGPTAIHAILIDRSDPIPPIQAQEVRQKIDLYIANARIGERFDLYVAAADTVNVLSPITSVCSPGRGDQASELYQNPGMIQRQFEEKFVAVLRENLRRLLTSSTADSSPILESVRAAAVSSFGDVEDGKVPLQMTIVSDFVQHSASTSHFRGETNFEEISKRPVWRQLQANLKGATVNGLYLLRASAVRNGQPVQNRGHQLFWEKAILSCGAGEVRFTVL